MINFLYDMTILYDKPNCLRNEAILNKNYHY